MNYGTYFEETHPLFLRIIQISQQNGFILIQLGVSRSHLKGMLHQDILQKFMEFLGNGTIISNSKLCDFFRPEDDKNCNESVRIVVLQL
jgi:hypothetical protein